jgi:hypothetical protein
MRGDRPAVNESKACRSSKEMSDTREAKAAASSESDLDRPYVGVTNATPLGRRTSGHGPTAVTACQCCVSDLALDSCSSPIAWKLDRGPGVVEALPHDTGSERTTAVRIGFFLDAGMPEMDCIGIFVF